MPSPPPQKPPSGDAKHLVIDRARRQHKPYVKEIVRQIASEITSMSKKLRRDDDFMLELVEANPKVINFLDDKLMLKAIKLDVGVLAHISPNFACNYEFWAQAFRVDVNALGYASPQMLKHFDISAHINDRAFWDAQEGGKDKTKLYISDRDRALYVLKHAENALAIISEDLNKDTEVVLEAWRDGMHAIDDESPLLWCDGDLYKDESFMKKLLVKAPSNAEEILQMTNGEGFSKEFYIDACKQNKVLCSSLPKEVLSVLVADLLPRAD
jgi:hypothetical protein